MGKSVDPDQGLHCLPFRLHLLDSLLITDIRDWNALPDSLIASAEGTEDGVAKFTSLVRASD